ncbi:MAG: hypothetical protein DHS20C18_23810 [Saprospiraceae bacterium]|nr:MAG: hypothetical protein DHS20C18_23810 [Saprospiraceae bacterium]
MTTSKHVLSLILLLFSVQLFYAQQTVGVFQNDASAYNGYTLFAPSGNTTTYLIDNCGLVINTWISDYPPGQSAYLLENGNLLRTAFVPSSFNGGGSGGRIELYSWEGALLWAYTYSSATYHHHHDIAPMPNGHILLIAWEQRSQAEAIAAGRNPNLVANQGIWSERIVEIEPVGSDGINIIWQWHLWDHLVQDFDENQDNYGAIAEHPELMDINYGNNGLDWIHLNAINYNPALDQIVVSARGLSEIWVIDHSTTTEEAAGNDGDFLYRWGNPQVYDRGTQNDQQFYGQHDVQWIAPGLTDAGKIMVYNNGQGRPGGNYSSVDIIEPPVNTDGNYELEAGQAYGPTGLSWSYVAQPPNSFYSPRISGVQRLPNGNTIICEGTSGHLFEIDNDGNTVWDYISPIRGNGPVSQGDVISQNSVFRAYRYGQDYGAFANKELIPGDPIELNPLDSDCVTYTDVAEIEAESPFRVLSNPVYEMLLIENLQTKGFYLKVVNANGQVIYFAKHDDALIEIGASGWPNGLYVIQLMQLDTLQLFSQKIIKI